MKRSPHFFFYSIILVLGGISFAQLSTDEAQARLHARQAQRAAGRATTQPIALRAAVPPTFTLDEYPTPLRQLWVDGEAERPERLKWLETQIRSARITTVHLQDWNAAKKYAPTGGDRTQEIILNREWMVAAQKETVRLSQPYSYLDAAKAENAEGAMSLDGEGYVTCHFTISQIIDAENLLVANDKLLITGIKTSNFVDNEAVTARGVLFPVGTRQVKQRRLTDTNQGQYESVVGAARTIRVCRLVPVDPIRVAAWLQYKTVLAMPHVPAAPITDPGLPPRPPPPPLEHHQIIN